MLKILQSRGNGVRRGTKSQFPESTKTLKGHDIFLGSMLFLNKKAPTPRFKMNLYTHYDVNTGRLIIPDDIKETIDKLDVLLRGKTEHNAYAQVFTADGEEDVLDVIDDEDDSECDAEIEELPCEEEMVTETED
jgi:hypothetical protein